jgi:DNA-binding MarR family transcriptional regulator
MQAPSEDALSGSSVGFDIENSAFFQLAVAANLTSGALSKLCSRHQLGMTELQVIFVLKKFGVLTGKAIAAHTHMHKTKISRAVANLQTRRLIARSKNETDLRESLLSLSKSGHAAYETLVPILTRFERSVLDLVDTADREPMKRALHRLVEMKMSGDRAP